MKELFLKSAINSSNSPPASSKILSDGRPIGNCFTSSSVRLRQLPIAKNQKKYRELLTTAPMKLAIDLLQTSNSRMWKIDLVAVGDLKYGSKSMILIQ